MFCIRCLSGQFIGLVQAHHDFNPTCLEADGDHQHATEQREGFPRETGHDSHHSDDDKFSFKRTGCFKRFQNGDQVGGRSADLIDSPYNVIQCDARIE